MNTDTIFPSLRKEFPLLEYRKDFVYLDSAATTLKPASVIATERAYEERYSANIGRGLYPIAEEATLRYEDVREQTARFINAKTREIIFTKNATDSINTVALMIASRIEPGDNIIVTAAEHHSNFLPWIELARARNAELRIASFDEEGYIDRQELIRLVDDRTVLVAFHTISNVFGALNQTEEIACNIRSKNSRTLILVDAAQAIGHSVIDAASWDADFIAFSAHKAYGPTGVGILYGKSELLETLSPTAFGGGMVLDACPSFSGNDGSAITLPEYKNIPYRFEAGTPNISGVIGWGSAIDFIETIGVSALHEHELSLTRYALERLCSVFEHSIRILGPTDPEKRGGLISFTIDGIHPHDLAHFLGEQGIAIRAGEHCAAPLHRTIGLPATARISFGAYSSEQDVDRLIEGIREAKALFIK